MKKFGGKLIRAFFSIYTLVTAVGIFLSVAMHELLHIVIHWGEINSIHIFPDTQAIVEVIFTPTAHYNLDIEEAAAYTITMVTLLLTAMLLSDIHDVRNTTRPHHSILKDDLHRLYENEERAVEDLARLLGIGQTARL